MESLYDRIGGQSRVAELADCFYDVMQRDANVSLILNMHPDDLTRSREKLQYFLCELFGGPKLFGENYVNPEWLKLRHQHLNIGIEARDQWMHCMTTAMQELNFDAALQRELSNSLFELAGFVRTRV